MTGMDIYRLSILFAYLVVQGIQYYLKLLNLLHMKEHCSQVPVGFEGYIERTTLGKSCAYTIESGTLSFVESLLGNAVVLLFLYAGFLNLYNSWFVSLGLSFVLHGVLFFLCLMYATEVLSIPFNLYDVFKIENKYGFNTMTVRLWLADFVKSTALSTVLAGTVLFCSLWIIRRSPEYWWLFLWGFFFLLSIFLMYISPYVIEPLFNKFTPLEGKDLECRIKAMMEKAGIKVSRVFRMDASKRSRHSNAYFSGIGKVKRIVLFDTLIDNMTPDEILAVLAHEAGHWKKKHVVKMIAVMEIVSLAAAYAAHRLLATHLLSEVFSLSRATFFSDVVVLGFLFGIASFPFTPLFSYFSRRHENEADRFALRLTGNPESLASALIKLSKENLSNLYPHPLYAKIYYSHPPVVKRIAAIRTEIELIR